MWSKIRSKLPVVALVLVVAFILFVIRPLFETQQGPDGRLEPTTSATGRPTPDAVPTESPSASPDAPLTPLEMDDRSEQTEHCKDAFGERDYKVLFDRLIEYERLYRERAPSDAYEGLATDYFIAWTHDSSTPDPDMPEIVIDTDMSLVTCKVVAEDQLVVLIQPMISTYRNEDGNRRLENGPYLSDPHYTAWVKDGSDWKVNVEY